jgi:queuine/archaeosine tRNA-ribosyltransferase
MFMASEPLGQRLLALHNTAFVIGVMTAAREAITRGSFDTWASEWLARYRSGSSISEDVSVEPR